MNGRDINAVAASDLAYAVWKNGAWFDPDTLADTPCQLSQPALTVLSNGDAMATWLADAAGDGSAVTVWASVLRDANWSVPVLISDAAPGGRNWPRVVALPDGSALALWSEEDSSGAVLMTAKRGREE